MFGLKPKPIEHENLLQRFIDEVAHENHQLRFEDYSEELPDKSHFRGFSLAIPLDEDGLGKRTGVRWTAKTSLPSGLWYGFSLHSNTRHVEGDTSGQAALMFRLLLEHPNGQRQYYTWKTGGKSGIVESVRTMYPPKWMFWKDYDFSPVIERDMEPAEARKIVALAKRFAILKNLKLTEDVGNAEEERVRLIEGVKNIRING